MKKTFNINLAGFPFVIDEDAFNLLNDYLETIGSAFKSTEDGGEIVNDIESRIAELLFELDPEKHIVTISDISKVISRIGKPEEILDLDQSENVTAHKSEENDDSEKRQGKKEDEVPPPYNPGNKSKFNLNFNLRKKLFRDPRNALLGGVCSGLAHYFNIDPTLVRIIAVLLIFLSATTVGVAYIILWIIVPEARTPMQRMEMMGEEPTMENIGKTVTYNYAELNNEETKEPGNSFSRFVIGFLSVFLKILIVFGLIIGCIILFALFVGLIGCLIALFIEAFNVSDNIDYMGHILPFWLDKAEFIPLYGIICGIGGIITIGVPLFLLVRKGWNSRNNKPDITPGFRRTLLVTWIIGILILIISIVKLVRINNVTQIHYKDKEIARIEEIEISENLDSIGLIDNAQQIDSVVSQRLSTDSIDKIIKQDTPDLQ